MSAVGDVYDLMSWSAMCYGDEHETVVLSYLVVCVCFCNVV
jgi:hypothetical protein